MKEFWSRSVSMLAAWNISNSPAMGLSACARPDTHTEGGKGMYICMYVYAMYGRVLTHRDGREVAGHFLQELDIRIACCI